MPVPSKVSRAVGVGLRRQSTGERGSPSAAHQLRVVAVLKQHLYEPIGEAPFRRIADRVRAGERWMPRMPVPVRGACEPTRAEVG
jgi:hypothetical protein